MNTTTVSRSKIITRVDLSKTNQPLPKSWIKAAGLLVHKRKSLEKHLREVRQEWDRKSLRK